MTRGRDPKLAVFEIRCFFFRLCGRLSGHWFRPTDLGHRCWLCGLHFVHPENREVLYARYFVEKYAEPRE